MLPLVVPDSLPQFSVETSLNVNSDPPTENDWPEPSDQQLAQQHFSIVVVEP
jgi:hypothetical protein